MPAIVGWPDEQFVAVMLSYKNRERPNQIMQTIAGRLSQAEIEALAAWFGAKAPGGARKIAGRHRNPKNLSRAASRHACAAL